MKVAFVLANTKHGALIVNRFDYNHIQSTGDFYGVGAQLLEHGAYDLLEVQTLGQLLDLRRQYNGNGVVFLDCGANIGVHSTHLSDHMDGWGTVIAIEAQERLFYALAGNLALHNCLNARAIWAAVAGKCDYIDIPEPDYTQPASFGSFELRQTLATENIGQKIDYDKPTSRVRSLTIDSLELQRLDLLKMDIEGMELEAISGALETIKRCKPIVFVECIKADKAELEKIIGGLDYTCLIHGMNLLCAHKSDRTFGHLRQEKFAA